MHWFYFLFSYTVPEHIDSQVLCCSHRNIFIHIWDYPCECSSMYSFSNDFHINLLTQPSICSNTISVNKYILVM